MKRTLFVVAAVLLSIAAIKAQGALDAYKYSQKDLRGTARYISLAGAMGARGGDISAITVNPAGIGMYKSYEVAATLDLQNTQMKSTFLKDGVTGKEDKFNARFNNLGFVATFPVYNDVAPLVNVGFSYNKLASFDKKYKMTGSNLSRRLVDYMADRATALGRNTDALDWSKGNVWRDEDWLSVVGYNGWLIDYTDDGKYIPFDVNSRLESANDLYVEEKGSINTYDFNIGTTFSNMLSVGLTLSVTDIDYKMSSRYVEDFLAGQDATGDIWNGYYLENELRTEGTGWKLGLGVIFKPIEEIRIGIAYHSPTWYDMTDHSLVVIDHYLTDLSANPDLLLNGYPEDGERMEGNWARYEYRLRTPDRWVFSLSGAIGNIANISVDYELNDYTKSKFEEKGTGWYNPTFKQYIKDYYRLTSTVRAGVELSFSPKFFGRLGYSWQQSPYNNEFRDYLSVPAGKGDNFDTPGSIPHFVVEDDTHYFTWGLGYRITRNFYADLGFAYKTQTADLYTHSKSDVTELKQNAFQGALTLGFRF